ncbi:MAG TPA: hypothetical protein VMU99_09365 [Acidimicrobiales bacterium]|nr:hypothetical protein [Acidimicrobiales bacterium]
MPMTPVAALVAPSPDQRKAGTSPAKVNWPSTKIAAARTRRTSRIRVSSRRIARMRQRRREAYFVFALWLLRLAQPVRPAS